MLSLRRGTLRRPELFWQLPALAAGTAIRHNAGMPNGGRPSILVVEDERAIADTVVYALRTEGFSPEWCPTAGEARTAFAREIPALVVLDVGLPDANGFDFCRELRAAYPDLPVIFLTARGEVVDRVVGLEIGGDDYLTKPFSPRELTARVKAILRRTNGHGTTPSAATPTDKSVSQISNPGSQIPPSAPAFALDDARCQIAYRRHTLDLTRYEFRLLKALLAQPGRVFSRDQLMTAAWEEPAASLDRTVDAHIKNIRAKLRAVAPDADPIVTHRGSGYSLRDDP